jgi:hypothetical protein
MQVLNCPYSGAVLALELDGLGLKGTLPSGLYRLPLQYVRLSDNPGLHGSIPQDMATLALWHLSITNTSLNCHNDQLNDKQVVQLAEQLHLLPRDDWSKLSWQPGEQSCIDSMGWDVKGWGVMSPANLMSCELRFLPYSSALLSSTYVLGVGCECPAGTTKVLRSNNGLFKMVCLEVQYMWIVELTVFALMILYLTGVLHQIAANNKMVFVEWAKQQCQPGTLQIEGKV